MVGRLNIAATGALFGPTGCGWYLTARSVKTGSPCAVATMGLLIVQGLLCLCLCVCQFCLSCCLHHFEGRRISHNSSPCLRGLLFAPPGNDVSLVHALASWLAGWCARLCCCCKARAALCYNSWQCAWHQRCSAGVLCITSLCLFGL
jgi:hypothetical protein